MIKIPKSVMALLGVSLMSLTVICLPANAKPTIAVLELEAKGADPVEVSVITDELRLRIHELNRFDLLERERVNDILKEQKFSLTDCTTDECYVRVGQMLSVQKPGCRTGRKGWLDLHHFRSTDRC